TDLSGKIRMYSFPSPRMYCVIAIRHASIVFAAICPACVACSPKSPYATVLPRVASPFMRPLWLLRCLTRFGISAIAILLVVISQIDPDLDTNDALSRFCFRQPVVQMPPQGGQRNRAANRLLASRHFRASRTTSQFNLDSLDSRFHYLIERSLDRPPEAAPLLQLLGDVFADQLRTAERIVDFDDLRFHPTAGQVLQFGLQSVDLLSLAADDD